MSGKQLNTEATVGIKIDRGFVVFQVFFPPSFIIQQAPFPPIEICVSELTLKQLLFLDIQSYFWWWPSPVFPVASPDASARKDPLLGAAVALFQRITLYPSGLQR